MSVVAFTIAGITVAVDTLLNNRFAINDTGVEPLDRGGMAVIHAGRDTDTDAPIAAKTLLPDYQGNTNRRARFRREAEILKAVQHPNVVELVDVVDDRLGTWILMEHLEGENLRDKLKREGAFDPKTVSGWLQDVCAALEHIHLLGYVHLDMTPQNLFLTDDGDIKLIDFGIAQKAYTSPKREGDTLLGTATYISPEHGSLRVVTPASDIYSLGCVLFELLTNKQVFSEHADERGDLASDVTISLRQSTMPDLPSSIAPERGLPLWVDTVLAKALMPDAEDRYPSATAFAEAFDEHANPPFLRFPWSNRRQQENRETPPVTHQPVWEEPPETDRIAEPQEPSRAGRWLRREFRNARRALLVFALMLSVLFAAPMLGGSVAFDWLLGAVPGSNTEIIDGNWYMRSGPNTESDVRTLMQQGQSVRITGTPVVVNNQLWWPVSTEADGSRIHGWAHDDGIERTWLMNRAAGFELARETWSGRWNTLRGWLPG